MRLLHILQIMIICTELLPEKIQDTNWTSTDFGVPLEVSYYFHIPHICIFYYLSLSLKRGRLREMFVAQNSGAIYVWQLKTQR